MRTKNGELDVHFCSGANCAVAAHLVSMTFRKAGKAIGLRYQLLSIVFVTFVSVFPI